jgi:hypothetical protein
MSDYGDIHGGAGLDDDEFRALAQEAEEAAFWDADPEGEAAAQAEFQHMLQRDGERVYRFESAWESHPNHYADPCGLPVPCGCAYCLGEFGPDQRQAGYEGPFPSVRATLNQALHGIVPHPPRGGCDLPPQHSGSCMRDPRE